MAAWDREDLRRSERGATAVEYGLIVALIAAVIITIVVALGNDVKGGFDTVEDNLGGSQA
jgi:pilus assembly protein Flp/PilA